MNTIHRLLLAGLLAGVVPAAQAQWVMVARAVSGRIQRMEQQRTESNGGYDVATVILDAPADNVYQKALSGLKAHAPEVTIVGSDQEKHLIKFTNGQQSASLQATALGPKVTQLVIASSGLDAGVSGTSIVLQGVMKVCKEMNVTCTEQ